MNTGIWYPGIQQKEKCELKSLFLEPQRYYLWKFDVDSNDYYVDSDFLHGRAIYDHYSKKILKEFTWYDDMCKVTFPHQQKITLEPFVFYCYHYDYENLLMSHEYKQTYQLPTQIQIRNLVSFLNLQIQQIPTALNEIIATYIFSYCDSILLINESDKCYDESNLNKNTCSHIKNIKGDHAANNVGFNKKE